MPALASAIVLLAVTTVAPVQARQVPFAIKIAPSRYEVAIPEQRVVVLVRIRNARPTTAPVMLAVHATNARVRPHTVSASAGEVVHVTIVPRAPGAVHVSVTGTRQGSREQRSLDLEVWRGRDGVRGYARQLRNRFIAWLAVERPELGIDADTRWRPTIVWPYVLEVSHYLFFSEAWELGLSWHIMVPPYDWTTIYLRPRNALKPSMAFQIDSVSDQRAMPYEIDPPPEVTR